jgi:large subunit ribosomal protein L21
MYAIIKTGSHQMKVAPGSFIPVPGTVAEPGATVALDQVLFVEKDNGEIVAGAPFVANAKIVGVVEGETRGPKIRVFKKKRRKGQRNSRGHRSVFTRVRITEIIA